MRALSVRIAALLLARLAVSPPDPRPFIASIYAEGREGEVWGNGSTPSGARAGFFPTA